MWPAGRGLHTPALDNAVKDVLLNKMTMTEASKKFDLPYSTLHRYVMQHKHVHLTQIEITKRSMVTKQVITHCTFRVLHILCAL